MSSPQADPRPAERLRNWTDSLAGAGVGFWIGGFIFNAHHANFRDDPSLTVALLFAVAVPGCLTFLRYSVFYRSEAARMGWDMDRRSILRIAFNAANLAFALYAVLAVGLDWGIVAEASAFLAFGLYQAGWAVMIAATPRGARGFPWSDVSNQAVYAGLLIAIGFMGMPA